jgi:hypothetical protein
VRKSKQGIEETESRNPSPRFSRCQEHQGPDKSKSETWVPGPDLASTASMLASANLSGASFPRPNQYCLEMPSPAPVRVAPAQPAQPLDPKLAGPKLLEWNWCPLLIGTFHEANRQLDRRSAHPIRRRA